ncbi:MAG: PAS domain-containing protein [Myxococcales bacterium]|nr:PAS domain-containing protein [Myxococcales bacterium]
MPEVALAASEEAWRVAFDAIDDILCVISPTHELLEMNRAGCVSLGLPRDQVIGRKCYELIHGSDRPIAGCPCCRAVRSEGPEEAEYEQDGRTYNLAAWPILDAEQRVTALVHTVRDVTEQRRIKEEIEGLARFPEENRSPVLRIGADGTLRYANPAAQTSLTCWQLSLGQPVPQEWISLVDAALRDGERRQFELECGEQSYSFEICPVRASGYVNAYGHDVTERMRMERDIRDSWRLVSSVVENVPLMVFVKDAQDLRFVMVNKATEELLGFSRRELLGRSDRDFFPPEQAAFFICKDREVLASGAPVDVPEELVRTPHRGDRWLHTRKVCIKGADGSPKYLLGISEDITERKRDEAVRQELEGRLQAAQKLEAIGSLAGGVAHDFNNLLSVILSYNSLAMEALADGDPIREDLVEVRNAGESAASLTRQLLAFSRKQVLEPVTLDVNAVVASVEKMLRRVISAHIALVPVLSPDLGWIKADPCQIEQVLVNLVVNARDAMPDGGTITIETSNLVIDRHQSAATVGLSPGDYVRIAVGDTGSGMDEPTLARIFEPFFTTKSQGRGTGLGLSTVYGIIKQSGGEIWVSSELGRGTTFTLCFPRELSPPTAVRGESDEPSARRDAGTETVLVVEDEPALLGVARRALAEMGYKVLSAADAEQALSIADRHDGEIHLLVSDIMMPGMRGDHLAQRLLTTRPTLRVLYMTAYAQDGVAHHRVDLDPPAQLLHKPFTTAELTQRVRAVLDRDERGLGLGPSSAPQDATQI